MPISRPKTKSVFETIFFVMKKSLKRFVGLKIIKINQETEKTVDSLRGDFIGTNGFMVICLPKIQTF